MTDLPISDLADTLSRVLHPEYNALPLKDAILAVDKLLGMIDEARMWARHGYELGQRSNTWSDHGVAPAWLTDGHTIGFGWHVISACPDETSCAIHGRNETPAVEGLEDGAAECPLPPSACETRQCTQASPARSDDAPDPGEVHRQAQGYNGAEAWMWRCNGTEWCEGWIGLDLGSEEAARAEYERHARECHHATPTEAQLHRRFACPGWEYATTEGPRKQWDDADQPPYNANGEPDPTWERNTDAGRDGWERLDYTEESYWRRRVAGPATQVSDAPPVREMTEAEAAVILPRLAQSGVDTPGCDCGHDGMGAAWHGGDCAWRVATSATQVSGS